MEENIGGELTFRMIWQKLKRSAVRILVYALIGLIFMAGLLGVINIFLSKSQFETTITYYYEGVEAGEDPWGGRMDFVAGIKSPSNVETALRNCGYTEEEVDKLINPVIRNLSVIVDKSNVNKNADEIITSADYNFRIVLTQSSEIDGLINSKNDYTNIVSAITNSYMINFKDRYSLSTNLANISPAGGNYIAKYYNMNDNLDSFIIEVEKLNSKTMSFISSNTKMTFASLLSQANSIKNQINNYKSYVLSNGINVSNEQEQIKIEIENYYALLQSQKSQVTSYKGIIETIYGQNIILPDGTVSSSAWNNGQYEDLFNNYINALEEEKRLSNLFYEWVNYGKYYSLKITFDEQDPTKLVSVEIDQDAPLTETSQDIIDNADAKEATIIASYNALLAQYQVMLNEYNQGYNVQNLVRVTSQADNTQQSPITLMVFIILQAVVLVIAVIVAMAVTAKKGQMILRKQLNMKNSKEKDEKHQ